MAREPKIDPELKVVQHISSGSFSWEEAQKNPLKVLDTAARKEDREFKRGSWLSRQPREMGQEFPHRCSRPGSATYCNVALTVPHCGSSHIWFQYL
jgi:hypothetical protein